MSTTGNATSTSFEGRRRSSLQFRVGLFMGGAILLFAVVFCVLLNRILQDHFGELQDQITGSRIQQVIALLDRDAHAKIQLVSDNAHWKQVFDYISTGDQAHLNQIYNARSNPSGQDLIIFFNSQREATTTIETHDQATPFSTPKGLDLRALSASTLLGNAPAAGLVRDDQGLLLLAGAPIVAAETTAPIVGWLVYGTYLTPERIADINQVSGLRTTVLPPAQLIPPMDPMNIRLARLTKLLGRVEAEFPQSTTVQNDDRYISTELSFPSLIDQSPITLKVRTPIAIYRNAIATKNRIFLLAIFGAGAVAIFGLIALHFSVIRPLADLDRGMQRMSNSPDELGYLEVRGQSEIARLAHSANTLLKNVMEGRRDAEEGRKLLASVLNSAMEGIIAFRAVRNERNEITDFTYALLNKSAETQFHLSTNKVVGRSFREYSPQMAGSEIYEHLVRSVELNKNLSFEVRLPQDDMDNWYHISISPWGDGIVATFETITERKAREQELARSYADMERFKSVMMGREERIIAIKREVNELRTRLGLKPIYGVNQDE